MPVDSKIEFNVRRNLFAPSLNSMAMMSFIAKTHKYYKDKNQPLYPNEDAESVLLFLEGELSMCSKGQDQNLALHTCISL